MKKQFKFLVAALTLSTLAANAQQLPNVGFDSWGKCEETTWTSTMRDGSFTRPDKEPTGWNGSSVLTFNVSQVLCKKGTDSGNYAQILNSGVLGNNIPGYLCIAQPWVFVGGRTLLEAGMIKENEILYNKEGKEICKVNIDGNVYDNDEVLSIHKMSAKYLNRTNNNGWDYFYVKEN